MSSDTTPRQWGATEEEWTVWAHRLGLADRLLPVVSNPNLPLAEGSRLPATDRGKVPSMLARGAVVGITKWPDREFTDVDRAAWTCQPNYGIALRTGVRGGPVALVCWDLDLMVAELVDDVLLHIMQFTGAVLPVRWRANSPKVLVPMYVELPHAGEGASWGERIAKRRMQAPGEGTGAIELLGDGQQAVVAGTHPSGARIQWRWPGGRLEIPTIDADTAEGLWASLRTDLGATEGRAKDRAVLSVARDLDDACDPVLEALRDAGLVLDERADGKVFVDCPWKAEHSDGGARQDVTQAVYFPSGVGGRERRWRCAHDHCLGRGVTDFVLEVGLRGVLEAEMLDAIPLLPALPPLPAGEVIVGDAPVGPAAGAFDPERIGLRPQGDDGFVSQPDLYSEVAMAESIVQRAHGTLAYASDIATFMMFDGHRWSHDRTGRGFDLARLTAKRYALIAKNDQNLGKGARVAAQRLESARTVAGISKLVANDQRIATTMSTFDAAPWLINTPRGTLNIETGSMRPAERDDRLTMCTTVAPDWSAPRPVFDRFILEVADGDESLVDYLQTHIGYCLTGDTSLHALFAWHGTGRNGKSTLVDLMLHLAGGYAAKIPATTLMSDKNGRHPTEIAMLKGLRAAIASEVEEGAYWSESKVKELTGDAVLTARVMRGDFFSFNRTHKHIVLCNHRPRLRSADVAMVSRLKMVPFLVSFAGREDPTLPERLLAEGPAILAWMLDGAMAWHTTRRMPECDAVERATREYFAAQSTVQMWVAERCIEDPSARQSARELYADYRLWKEERGEQPVSQTLFGEQLSAKFNNIHTAKGRVYGGLLLNPAREGVGL